MNRSPMLYFLLGILVGAAACGVILLWAKAFYGLAVLVGVAAVLVAREPAIIEFQTHRQQRGRHHGNESH